MRNDVDHEKISRILGSSYKRIDQAPLAKHINPAEITPHDTDPKKRGRLAIEAKHNESLWLKLENGDLVEIVARKRSGNKMRFVICAPQSVRILRDKLLTRAAS